MFKFDRRLSYLFREIQSTTRARLEDCLRDLGITIAQYTVLCRLRGRGGTLSSAALARRHGVTPQSMNEVIAALEGQGLIERHESRDNRRILLAVLTRAGNRLLDDCDRRVDGMEAEMFGHLPSGELGDLHRQLENILDRLRALDGSAPKIAAAEQAERAQI